MNRETDMTDNVAFPETMYASNKKGTLAGSFGYCKDDYLFARINLLVVAKTRLSIPNWTFFTNVMFAGTWAPVHVVRLLTSERPVFFCKIAETQHNQNVSPFV